MAISEKNIRFIFGLKLRQVRMNRGYSLAQLSEKSGVSISYLNEIEKGKKYPKAEKIIALTKALDTNYDELVSLQLNRKLAPVSELIRSNVLEELPLEFFGIEAGDLLELLSEAPTKLAAFVNAIIQIGRTYDIHVEHFYFAVLRSYQEMHDNYMPEIEKAVEEFMVKYKLDPISDKFLSNLTQALEKDFNYEIVPGGLQEYPEIMSLRHIVLPGKKNRLLLHPDLNERQIRFIMGREAGYAFMNLKERSFTSSWIGSKKFDHVLNNYKAYYFGGALITDGKKVVKDIEEFMAQPNFEATSVHNLLDKYQASAEMFFHRLTSLIPHYLRFNEIFFFRYNHLLLKERFSLTKELHGSGLQRYHGSSLSEKACSRWCGIQILKKYHARRTEKPLCEAYRVKYANSTKEYFIISVADSMKPTSNMNYSVSIGFLINERFNNYVRFLQDNRVENAEVAYSWIEHSSEYCEDNIEDPEIRKRQTKSFKLREAVNEILSQES